MDINIQAILRELTPQMQPISLEESAKSTANKNRCGACRKKLNLTDLECRCSTRFCIQHRAPEEHKCTFDFKAAGRARLEKQLEKAVADKVERF